MSLGDSGRPAQASGHPALPAAEGKASGGGGDPPALLSRGRNWTKAEVHLVRRGESRVVVKSIEGRCWIVRVLLSVLMTREARLLARLQDVPGVPRLVESTSERIVTEWIDGEPLGRRTEIDDDEAAGIRDAVRALHEAGFAHGDLASGDIVLARDGNVRLVDFATAVGPGHPPVLWRLLVPILQRRDRARVAKLSERYLGRREKRLQRRERAGRGG